jgi:hypothetical protein
MESESDELQGEEGAPDTTDWKAEARKWERRLNAGTKTSLRST